MYHLKIYCVYNSTITLITKQLAVMRIHIIAYSLIVILITISSCATFRSPIKGEFNSKTEKNYNAERVKVLFIFSHYRQTIGYDAIPKLDNKRERIRGFDDFFLDALTEISNIENYLSYTEYASDVSNSQRKATKDSLLKKYDLIINIKFMREKSFTKFFFSTIVSAITATVVPIRYKYKYLVEVNVLNSKQQLLKSYSREASLNKWVQTFMLFVYPFHHEKRKKEELYVEFLHNIFLEMEHDKILTSDHK